jgi:hypothetical protein
MMRGYLVAYRKRALIPPISKPVELRATAILVNIDSGLITVVVGIVGDTGKAEDAAADVIGAALRPRTPNDL